MNFLPPPYADDVPEDTGPYSRDEIIVARTSLLHRVQQERSAVWQRIKNKLGILPNGQRVQVLDPEHVWLPRDIPPVWSAPIVLHDPRKEFPAQEPITRGAPTDREWNSSSSGHHARSKSAVGNGENDEASQSVSEPSFAPADHFDIVTNTTVVSFTSDSAEELKDGESSTRSKSVTQEEEVEAKITQYDVMFRCDLCLYTCVDELYMKTHLSSRGHYSASKYLGSRDHVRGMLTPLYLSSACVLRDERQKFKFRVPVCPVCHTVFPDILQCAQHAAQHHKMEGRYSLRSVQKKEKIQLNRFYDQCCVCKIQFKNNSLGSHILKTQHMLLYVRKPSVKRMMFFPCKFCGFISSGYFEFKKHMFDAHSKGMDQSEVISGVGYVIGVHKTKSSLSLLPRLADQGMSQENIKITSEPAIIGSFTNAESKQTKKKKLALQKMKKKVSASRRKLRVARRKLRAAVAQQQCTELF